MDCRHLTPFTKSGHREYRGTFTDTNRGGFTVHSYRVRSHRTHFGFGCFVGNGVVAIVVAIAYPCKIPSSKIHLSDLATHTDTNQRSDHNVRVIDIYHMYIYGLHNIYTTTFRRPIGVHLCAELVRRLGKYEFRSRIQVTCQCAKAHTDQNGMT